MKLSNKNQARLLSNYGNWALITGASSGIGRELAFQLAESGFNLIINARNSIELEKLSEELQTRFNCEIVCAVADLASPEGIQLVIQSAANYPIGLLVASAGFGTSGLFINNALETEVNMLRVNCEALLKITHHFSQQFANQKRGGIVLLSSIVAFQGVPFSANYAATKAYVQTLAEGIKHELKPFNVDVLAVAPGPVNTRFANRAGMHMSVALHPEEVAISILKSLGKRTTVFPGLLSKVMAYALRTAPRALKIKIMGKVMKKMAV